MNLCQVHFYQQKNAFVGVPQVNTGVKQSQFCMSVLISVILRFFFFYYYE